MSPKHNRLSKKILNSYHEKAFAAQTAGDAGASTWSSRSGKTLEEETVDELTAAGYEAYNVTSENYEALEEALQTDFADMGLNPEGSYIIVISGEDPAAPTNPNSRAVGGTGSLPEEDFIDDGAGGFTYTKNGVEYTMRYITLTNADANGELFVSTSCMLAAMPGYDDVAAVLGEYALTLAGEKIIESLIEEGLDFVPFVGEICSGIELIHDVVDAFNPFETLEAGTLVFRAGTAWTRSYIQIYDPISGRWKAAQCSTYAVSEASFDADYVYNPETNAPMRVGGIFHSGTVISPYYNALSLRQSRAVEAYWAGIVLYDCTGDIEFYFKNTNNDHYVDSIHIFTHEESTARLID